MAGFARHLCAVLVAIVVVAAQVMPAWAGCHSQRHAAAAMTDVVQTDIVGHHSMSHTSDSDGADGEVVASLAALDQAQPSQNDICLGNCGCACGLTGAFVLTAVTAIDAPHGILIMPGFASADFPLGDKPDGPRRPPRTTA